jgi:hypothetical protein
MATPGATVLGKRQAHAVPWREEKQGVGSGREEKRERGGEADGWDPLAGGGGRER